MKFVSWTSGKKTYIVAALALGLGIANGLGWHEPEWVDWLLAAAGLGAGRAAIQKQAATTAADAAALINQLLSQLAPETPARAVTLPSGHTIVLGQPTGFDGPAVTAALNKQANE